VGYWEGMDIQKMIAELRAEHQQINEAILVIERLAVGGAGKRRGRPPKWMSMVSGGTSEAVAPTAKRTVSPAARKRMSAAQKKRWAEKKAQADEAES
jgi:hypothetical protein